MPTPAPYVIDRHAVVWRVVRDGGMATRADYAGITSVGIVRLEQEAGPLVPFHPLGFLLSTQGTGLGAGCTDLCRPAQHAFYCGTGEPT